MSFNFSPKVVTDGLVLYLDAANTKSYTSGSTTWNDISRGGNNGTLVNGPTFSSTNGGSLLFDGIDDYGDLGSNSNLNLTGPFTLSVWFRLNSASLNTIFLGRNRGGAFAYTFFQMITGKPRLLLQNGITSVVATSPNTYSINRNYNLTTVVTTTEVIHYVNGVFDSTTPSGGVLPNYSGASNWTLGANAYGSFTAYGTQNQYITSIYNRALSAAEILQNYNATKSRFGL